MFGLIKRLFGGGRKNKPTVQRRRPSGVAGAHSPPFGASRPAALDALDNPSLGLDTPEDGGFDPYNTGTFNRSGSWERINKRRNS